MRKTDKREPLFPAAPVIIAGHDRATILTTDGELMFLSPSEAASLAQARPPIVCHRGATAKRLGLQSFIALDVLELFAFVRPGQFSPPTPPGLADALALPHPPSLEDHPRTLLDISRHLLGLLQDNAIDFSNAVTTANAMAFGGWPWGSFVLHALGRSTEPIRPGPDDLAIWRSLPEWEDEPASPPPGSIPIDENETGRRLTELLGPMAENRPQQFAFSCGLVDAFAPREREGEPRIVIAEAGTGVGKTLGYLAPADLWATLNSGTVWISTYTRNLQHQVDQEASRIFPDPDQKRDRVVVRKGRENYLCLLNFEERARAASQVPENFVSLGLMARWIAATRDGDLTGPDFPSWLSELFEWHLTTGLADRRGECIYSACFHYRRCFIESVVRRARRAELVIANHALVLLQSALGGGEDMGRVTRLVFDEGHHLFDAADNAFSTHLTGREAAELRRWLLGPEGRKGSRARGLRRRVDDLIAGHAEAERLIDDITRSAAVLPGPGWLNRVSDHHGHGPLEQFLTSIHVQVLARSDSTENSYSLEADIWPVDEKMQSIAGELRDALSFMLAPLDKLSVHFRNRLDQELGNLDTDTRRRIEAIERTLTHRAIVQVRGWIEMVGTVLSRPDVKAVDWFSVDRADGRQFDIGMHRHLLDPMRPFADIVAAKAHGLVVTSATLRDETRESKSDWQSADIRTGTAHLPGIPRKFSIPSPFDLPAQTRVFVLNDVRRNEPDQVAAAFRELFIAAEGGALGLFTAISRLRETHRRIVGPLEQAGLPLLAQHVDALSNATLVEMFRADPNTCLLGTDAMRDGVDIPGSALRLLVFDRVPWARRSILHRARRRHFGPASAYDDMIARLRLKQAFGRLIRRVDDRGVFVMVDSRLPSRLLSAFPEGVSVERVGLAETIGKIRAFLAQAIDA